MQKRTGQMPEWFLVLRKYILRNPRALIGIFIIVVFAAVAVFADSLSSIDPNNIAFFPWETPSPEHPLGTNSYGQDIFSQVVHGSRITLLVGILAGLLTSLIGTAVGLVAGYKGGAVSEVLMRIVDVFLTIPSLAFTIVISSMLPQMTVTSTILVIGALNWMWMARSVRSQTLSESRRDYVDAARALGMSDAEIMFKEILPNIIPVITANMVMVITSAMLTEASLSFLGIGDPTSISWGKMLSTAFDNGAIIYEAWNWILPPGLCIATLGYSFMLIGNSFLDIYANDRGGAVKL
ncbi:MAG TPA: ABC transporter permease [Candidatus Faecivicinus avistercoris]|nr:ABC transporter permease [Candidatus Faecivicinus avistercoris]